MNSTVDTSAALAPAAARFDRQRADARQQRWMAELEQAMLAQQPGRPVEAAPKQQEDAGHAPVQAAPGAAAPASVTRAAPSGAPAAAVTPAAAAASATPASDAASTLQQADQQAGGKAHAHAAGTAFVAAAASYGGGTVLPSAAATVSASIVPQSAGPSPGVAGAAIATADGGAIEAAAPQRAPGTLAPFGAAASRMAAQEGEAMAPEGGAAQAGDEAPAEEYEQRVLHLFHGEDGVQAYIRDAELGGAQLRAVAQALALELGAGGQRLAGLTVNGRRVGADGSAEEEQAPATAYDAAPPRITEKGQH